MIDSLSNESTAEVVSVFDEIDKTIDQPTDDVRIYLNAIGKIPLLNATEEVELAKDIEAGLYAKRLLQDDESRLNDNVDDLLTIKRRGESAREKLIAANLRLVIPIAMRYNKKSVPLWDLIQEGNVGVSMAAMKFDYKMGNKFSTLATAKIFERIIRSFYDQGRRQPLSRLDGERLSKFNKIRDQLEMQLGRIATEQELADATGWNIDYVHELNYINAEPLCLDDEVADTGLTLGDYIEDKNAQNLGHDITVQNMRDKLDTLLFHLDEQDEIILRRSMGYGCQKLACHAIAEEIGVSKSIVERRKKKILESIRYDVRNAHLQDFLR